MSLRLPLPVLAAAVLASCRPSANLEPVARRETPDALWLSEDRSPQTTTRRPPAACATLTDDEGPDILRALPEAGLALYADRHGLAIIDIANPDEPAPLVRSQFSGEPLGVFDFGSIAVVVYEPSDGPSETVIRAVDLRRRSAGQLVGELILDGSPRDARRTGDILVVTRELETTGKTKATAVSTFSVDANNLSTRDEALLPGGGAAVGGSPWGVAVAREADRAFGKDRTAVTWLGVDDQSGALERSGTFVIDGVVPRWRRGKDHVIDVTEDATVRVIGCASTACPAGDRATYAAIDFANASNPRLISAMVLARAGDAVFNFSAERLFVARPPQDGHGRNATDLAVFDTTREPQLLGTVAVEGTVASIALRGEHVVALGWTGNMESGPRAILHDLDVRTKPRLVGSVAFGGDWTWSAAYDDDRAMSFQPDFTLGALPMTTLRGSIGPIGAVQVLSFARTGPRAVTEIITDSSGRLLFVDGRILSFTEDGVSVIYSPDEKPVHRSWEELGLLAR